MGINLPISDDAELHKLLDMIDSGELQLPNFQRGWTWDDLRIRNIIASLTQGYPMGAIMQLEYGGSEVKLGYRAFEGSESEDTTPRFLILDGQQRLTSLYNSLMSQKPIETTNERKQKIQRYYYLDMEKCIDPDVDRLDAVISVPASRVITKDIGRAVVLDLSSPELEIEQKIFPVNLVFSTKQRNKWFKAFVRRYEIQNAESPEENLWDEFEEQVLDTIDSYKIPVITLNKTTPREAVCKVFENVNTGGIPLTVFELVTASFATHDFNLRENWEEEIKPRIRGNYSGDITTDLMYSIDATAFLTSMTLLSNYKRKRSGIGHTSCKKKDVLSLSYEEYKRNLNELLNGFDMAREFLTSECIFRKRDLPYTTQIIPLAATCAFIGRKQFDKVSTKNVLRRWFWCGIFGEMYGGANESRYSNDIEDLADAVEGKSSANRTVNSANFQSNRLLGLKTRNSAAYKGIMALIFREDAKDFIDGTGMTSVKAKDTPPDIHHIFPQAYCEKIGLDKDKWDCVVNKTPLIARTNRLIGGTAPSKYIPKIKKEGELSDKQLRSIIESHLIDFDFLAADDFDAFFISRAKKILEAIESAMGKSILDRRSSETVKNFGSALD